ncbi:hypothetical protein EUGRSUZ_B03616 [Eucalyptus grandis]|uniref:Uncharacterized protein n=2 Tax=Eucalyptus grandis TaxID=71139 RepID=A0ACC3LX75_EUCGR|nr:hypothetical protein EUGRSUZ_B03616 [Eucalyptus grandis]
MAVSTPKHYCKLILLVFFFFSFFFCPLDFQTAQKIMMFIIIKIIDGHVTGGGVDYGRGLFIFPLFFFVNKVRTKEGDSSFIFDLPLTRCQCIDGPIIRSVVTSRDL